MFGPAARFAAAVASATALLNGASVALKRGEPGFAAELCEEALRCDGRSVKALRRLAQARKSLFR